MPDESTTTKLEITDALQGKQCWYVSCGGGVGSTFELAIGEKRPRKHVVRNPAHSDEFRQFEGEANLLVWCTWRLDSATGPITSADDDDQGVAYGLNQLVGETIQDACVDSIGMDLRLQFSSGHTLRIFCDHVGHNPSFDGNWELILPDKTIAIGVGSRIESETRE